MLDFLKIDFFKTPDFGDQKSSRSISSSVNFDNFLQDQLKSMSELEEKFGRPDKTQNDSRNTNIEQNAGTAEIRFKEKVYEKETDKKKDTVREESAERSEHNTDIKKLNRNKDDKPAEEAKVSCAGKEEIQKSKNEKDTDTSAENPSLVKMINLLLNMMKGVPEKGDDAGLLKSLLRDIKNSLTENSRDFNKNKLHLKRLFSELKSVLANLEKELQKGNSPGAGRELMLSSLRKQSERIADTLKKYAAREADILSADGTGKESIGTKGIINTAHSGMINNDKKEKSLSRDYDTAAGFQFTRKEGISKDSPVSMQRRNSDFSEYVDKLIHNARIVVRDSRNGSFSLRLYPESLGRVNVNLTLEQGVIMGRFLVDNAEARDSLLENMAMVKQELEQSGINVGEFQVNVRDERGNAAGRREEGIFAPAIGRDNAVSVSSEYEQNAASKHDGAIDVII